MPSRQEIEERLRELVRGLAAEAGLELVELALRGGGRKQVLRVDLDRAGARGVGIGDCQHLSQVLGRAIDEADLIPEGYMLEVSSPGTDRPIRSSDDIRRNTGRRVVVLAASDSAGAHDSHHGLLLGEEDGFLLVRDDSGQTVRIARERVVRAQQELVF